MAVDRNGFIEAAPEGIPGSTIGKVIVSLCPFLPPSYKPETPSAMEPTVANISVPKENTNNNSLEDETRPKNLITNMNNNNQLTTKETETIVQQTRVRVTETVQVAPLQIELDDKMKQLAIQPENPANFYNFMKPTGAISRVPENLLKRKYKDALQNLCCDIPGIIRNSDNIVSKLYSKRIISKSEKEKLKARKTIEGTEAQTELLIEVLEDKSENDISVFLKVLDDDRQTNLADWIRNTAEEIEKKVYNSGIFSRQQVLKAIPNMSARKEIASCETHDTAKHLEMVLSTVPVPGNTSVSQVGQSGHLIIGFTSKQGNDEIINQVKHCFFKMKSEFTKSLQTHCQCITSDHRSPEDKKSCAALISIEFKEGEREAYDILEQKLLDFESYVYEHKAILVSVVEGCIKFKVQIHDRAHLLSLEDDIRSGRLLANMATWFQKKGYQGSAERPMFMLVVDDDRIQHLKELMEEDENNKVLSFPVSYTYCQHEDKWLWSADKTYWFDITESTVQEGLYKGMTPEKADLMTFTHLATNSIKPTAIPEVCIVCKNKNVTDELKEMTLTEGVEQSADETDDVAENGLSFICDQISATLLDDSTHRELQNLVELEFKRTFKTLMENTKANLVFTGNIFEEADYPFITKENITCFFVGSDNKVGYEEDMDEGIRFCITESDDVPAGHLKLRYINDSTLPLFLNSKNTMIQLIEGLNLVVKENSEVFQIEIPIYMQPTNEQGVSEGFEKSQWVRDKTTKSKTSLPKLKGCFFKQTNIDGAVSPSLNFLSVKCKHENVSMDCIVHLAYHSTSWPSCAAEWIFRPRKTGWPDNKLVDTIITDGCYVIPVVDSGMEEYLWKFCFDDVEKTLLCSLPTTQRQTLVLLYILCHDSFQACGLPTPQQVKNIFLWGQEYKEFDNMGSYLLFLLNMMITKIKAKNLSHYFMKDVNLLTEFADDDLHNAQLNLCKVLQNPSKTLLAFATTTGGMPKEKPLEEIFKPVLQSNNLAESAAEECLKSLIVQLMAEENHGSAITTFSMLPSVHSKKECFSMMAEDTIKKIGSFLPLQDKILSLEYLVKQYPDSQSCQSNCALLAAIYHENSIQEADLEKKSLLMTKSGEMFQKALSFQQFDVALKVDYSYYLYNSRSYAKASEVVKQIIKKPKAADMAVLLRRHNFLYDGTEEKAKNQLLMWPYAFALYITIKSYQAQGKISEAKKYLRQLKDACNRVPEFEGSTTSVSMSSFELLGAAAKDLKEYEISTYAYQKLSNVQAVENLVLAQNQLAWKLVPPSPSVNPNKFNFEKHGSEKDFNYEFQV